MVVHGAQLENWCPIEGGIRTQLAMALESAKRWTVESRLKRLRPRFCKEELNLTTLYVPK